MNEEGIGISDAPLLTVSGLALFLSVAKSLVYKWVEEETIPHYRLGKAVRFDPNQVKDWLESRRINPQNMKPSRADFDQDVDKILKSTILRNEY